MPSPQDPAALFRSEALAVYRAGHQRGDVLRLSPRWTRWAYHVLLGVVLAAVLFAALGRVTEYASGPATVRLEGRLELTAASAGTLASVAVRPGQRVQAGDVLLRFYPAEEIETLERLTRAIGANSFGPVDETAPAGEPAPAARSAGTAALRAQQAVAQARLAARAVVAPRAGVVGEIRARPGQRVAPGDVLVALHDPRPSYSVVALLPAQYRPMLRPGLPLRVELAGFPYTYQRLIVQRVGEEILGPSEVRRFLGPAATDTLAAQGPVVLVWARLGGDSFAFEGRRLAFHDGMSARAEAAVRSRGILLTLLPALRLVLPDGD